MSDHVGNQNFGFLMTRLMRVLNASTVKEFYEISIYELRLEKTNILVSHLVRHKPGCTDTEDGSRLEISDLESRGIVLFM